MLGLAEVLTQSSHPTPPSILDSALSAAVHAFDRSDERVKAWQDLVLNVCMFAGAVWAMHRYGHKLAV